MGYSCGFMRSAALQQELQFLKRVTLKGHRVFGSEAFLQGNLFQLTAWLGRARGTFVGFFGCLFSYKKDIQQEGCIQVKQKHCRVLFESHEQ